MCDYETVESLLRHFMRYPDYMIVESNIECYTKRIDDIPAFIEKYGERDVVEWRLDVVHPGGLRPAEKCLYLVFAGYYDDEGD